MHLFFCNMVSPEKTYLFYEENRIHTEIFELKELTPSFYNSNNCMIPMRNKNKDFKS